LEVVLVGKGQGARELVAGALIPLGVGGTPPLVADTVNAWHAAALVVPRVHQAPLTTYYCPGDGMPIGPHKYAKESFLASGTNYLGGLTIREGKPTTHIHNAASGNFIDQEAWMITNDGYTGTGTHKEGTWVEAGYTAGAFSGGSTYNGGYYAFNSQPSDNYSGNLLDYTQFKLGFGGYPKKASSWYQFWIKDASATQKNWSVTAKVWSHSLASHPASYVGNVSTMAHSQGKAHTAQTGIETTCVHSYHGSPIQYVRQNAISISAKSQGSWHHFKSGAGCPGGTGCWNTKPPGATAPMYIAWDTGDTGYKVLVSQAST
jgi:hypothetical protein